MNKKFLIPLGVIGAAVLGTVVWSKTKKGKEEETEETAEETTEETNETVESYFELKEAIASNTSVLTEELLKEYNETVTSVDNEEIAIGEALAKMVYIHTEWSKLTENDTEETKEEAEAIISYEEESEVLKDPYEEMKEELFKNIDKLPADMYSKYIDITTNYDVGNIDILEAFAKMTALAAFYTDLFTNASEPEVVEEAKEEPVNEPVSETKEEEVVQEVKEEEVAEPVEETKEPEVVEEVKEEPVQEEQKPKAQPKSKSSKSTSKKSSPKVKSATKENEEKKEETTETN